MYSHFSRFSRSSGNPDFSNNQEEQATYFTQGFVVPNKNITKKQFVENLRMQVINSYKITFNQWSDDIFPPGTFENYSVRLKAENKHIYLLNLSSAVFLLRDLSPPRLALLRG